jgi:thymidylate synthase
MTTEYNPNSLFYNNQTLEELVSHYNSIEDFYEKNNMKWEDGEDENFDTQAVTFNAKIWCNHNKLQALEFYFDYHYQPPHNLIDELDQYYRKVIDHIDGFLLCPHGKYRGQLIEARGRNCDNIEEVVEFLKKEKESKNCQIFLYNLFEKPKREEEIILNLKGGSLNDTPYTMKYLQDLDTKIRIRYAILLPPGEKKELS